METQLFILLGSLIFIMVLWFLRRYFLENSAWQFKRLSLAIKEIENGRNFSERAANKLLTQIYELIFKEMDREDSKILYKALDLLKLAFGYGLGREKDPSRLTKIIFKALEANKATQTDILGYSIHAFNPFIRKTPPEHIPEAVEQLGIIALVSLKRHKNFLTSRAVEMILEGLERLGRTVPQKPGLLKSAAISTEGSPYFQTDRNAEFFQSPETKITKAIKLIGLAVLRSKDAGLFRELCVKINEFITGGDKNRVFVNIWPGIFAAWLNYLGRKENNEVFILLLTHLKLLVENDKFDGEALRELIAECRHTVGVSSLNPDNKFVLPILSFMLDISYKFRDIQSLRQAVSCAQEIAQIACSRREIEKNFALIYPLLEAGRKLMLDSLRDNNPGEDAVFIQKALEETVKCCLQIVRYEARKNFLFSGPDVILKLKDCWLAYPDTEGSSKNLSKFCHLLVLCLNLGKSKGAADESCQALKILLTEDEKKILKFLF